MGSVVRNCSLRGYGSAGLSAGKQLRSGFWLSSGKVCFLGRARREREHSENTKSAARLAAPVTVEADSTLALISIPPRKKHFIEKQSKQLQGYIKPTGKNNPLSEIYLSVISSVERWRDFFKEKKKRIDIVCL